MNYEKYESVKKLLSPEAKLIVEMYKDKKFLIRK